MMRLTRGLRVKPAMTEGQVPNHTNQLNHINHSSDNDVPMR
jgi:hypothetical protein